MATMEDLERIEAIKKIKGHARRNGKNPYFALANGKPYYYSAINSIQSSGFWTIISSAFCALMYVAINSILTIREIGYTPIDWPYFIGYTIGVLAITSIPLIFGIIIQKFETTPAFILAALIITLVFNIIFSVGVLPLISLVMNIIALVKWSSYKDWFSRIKTNSK